MIDAIEAWKQSGEAEDAAGAVSALTRDAELISPLTERFRFRGHDQIEPLLRTVFAVIDDYRYVAEAHAGEHVFLTATFRVAGTEVEEFQHLELAPDGRIARLALAMRPLPALTAFARALGPALATAQGDAGRAYAPLRGGVPGLRRGHRRPPVHPARRAAVAELRATPRLNARFIRRTARPRRAA